MYASHVVAWMSRPVNGGLPISIQDVIKQLTRSSKFSFLQMKRRSHRNRCKYEYFGSHGLHRVICFEHKVARNLRISACTTVRCPSNPLLHFRMLSWARWCLFDHLESERCSTVSILEHEQCANWASYRYEQSDSPTTYLLRCVDENHSRPMCGTGHAKKPHGQTLAVLHPSPTKTQSKCLAYQWRYRCPGSS